MLPMSFPCAARQIPGKTRHAQQSTLRSTKAAKKKVGVVNGWVTPSSPLTDFHWFWPWGWQIWVGIMTWFQYVVLLHSRKSTKILGFQKNIMLRVVWEFPYIPRFNIGSFDGKRIKSPKRWVEHGWAFIGAGFRSLLGHATVRSTGIDTELGTVTSQLGRITCYKLQVWWCGASISLDVFSWKQL